MSDHLKPPRLETLSNEVLLVIFGYFTDPIDLLDSFYGLNQRFDTLLVSCPIAKLYVADEDELTDACMEFFLPRAQSLYLRVEWPSEEQVLTQFYSRERFFQIKHLHVSSRAQIHPVLYELIFSNFFPFLRQCHLNSVESSSNWLGSPALKVVDLSLDDPETYECVLAACPNLNVLDINGSWGITISHSQSPSYVTQAPLAPSRNATNSIYPNLRRLEVVLKNRREVDTDLDNILALVPNVESLALLYGCLHHYNILETFTIIVKRLPNLQRIDCDLSINLSGNDTTILRDIHHLHPSFYRLRIDKAYVFYFLRTYKESHPSAPFPFSTIFPDNCVGYSFCDDGITLLQADNT